MGIWLAGCATHAKVVELARACLMTGCALALAGVSMGQQPDSPRVPVSSAEAPQNQADKPARASEVSGSGVKALKVKVNLVMVPVVVRDSLGHAVGNLQKEEFQLFDNHRLQEITHFSVEKADPRVAQSNGGAGKAEKFVEPNQFTAFLFDDVHLTYDELPQLRKASLNLVTNGLARTERVGIFTTSGKLTLDFTDDKAKLQEVLKQLKPNPQHGSNLKDCPDISFYEANQIVNRHDNAARDSAIADAMACGIKDPKAAEHVVMDIAERVVNVGNIESRLVLSSLANLVDRVSSLPGERTILLASPNFMISDVEHDEYKVIDRAVRGHVVINTLDARGVYTDDNDYENGTNVLAEFSHGTGGTFFRNSNNLDEGIRQLITAPEFVYELGFSPSEFKEDGKYHHLIVKVVSKNKLAIRAREGYFAPKPIEDPVVAENEEIRDALFSRAEIHELPVEMRTQFTQADKPVAKVSVSALVDLRELPHREANSQNSNELRIVAAVFDRNGKYLGAIDKKFAVEWKDDKVDTRTAAKYDFILDSGNYLVRLVVRESESQRLSAEDTLVEIPTPQAAMMELMRPTQSQVG